ncbi:MAG: phosphogluconate dehydratase [Bacteroidota bacterium]
MQINSKIQEVTDRIIKRSEKARVAYLNKVEANFKPLAYREGLSCGNLAHGFAACDSHDKKTISSSASPNIGLISAYNDMLSAHKTYENYPTFLRKFANEFGGTLQMAGATPAMCDGVTQGKEGMDLSLLSRDIIAFSTAIALSHDMFDGAMNLGICDKIVPGLIIGNLSFGHLPSIFVPGGPMESGISNEEKSHIRQLFAEGKIGREELLKGEADSYHSPGTCTFYGTANSNQMLMEIMGLQLPGSSFVNPGTPLREALNKEAVRVLIDNINARDINRTIGFSFDEKTVVNGIIGLLASGGSTNHTLHLPAMAKAAGIHITWDDFSELSYVVPLLCRIYPNGAADVNHFHAAGGMGFLIRTLLENGLLHEDVNTILGKGLSKYTKEPKINAGTIHYVEGAGKSLNEEIIRDVKNPFSPQGGIKVLKGNLGTCVIKTSAVEDQHLVIEAEAIVFDDQDDFLNSFKKDELNKDFIAVIPFQGPKFKGMPELHKLTPSLTILLKRGFKVALVTDGRMSGASGKVLSAIHLYPEAAEGGLISKIKTGDRIRLDAISGELICYANEIEQREARTIPYQNQSHGRELFEKIRGLISNGEEGAGII